MTVRRSEPPWPAYVRCSAAATLIIGPGPVIGDAYRYLLELRIERGPMSREKAIEELNEWARERGVRTE